MKSSKGEIHENLFVMNLKQTIRHVFSDEDPKYLQGKVPACFRRKILALQNDPEILDLIQQQKEKHQQDIKARNDKISKDVRQYLLEKYPDRFEKSSLENLMVFYDDQGAVQQGYQPAEYHQRLLEDVGDEYHIKYTCILTIDFKDETLVDMDLCYKNKRVYWHGRNEITFSCPELSRGTFDIYQYNAQATNFDQDILTELVDVILRAHSVCYEYFQESLLLGELDKRHYTESSE
jgi:hypothetical protein